VQQFSDKDPHMY